MMPDKTVNLTHEPAAEQGTGQHSSTTESSAATREQDPPIIEIYKPDPNDANRQILRFECVYCSKEFSERYLLKRHFPVHTGQRQYVCPFCGKTFTSGSSLSRHKSVHKSGSDFQCTICDKTFNRTSTLAAHMAIHSSEKKFVCKVCKKGFHQKVNLKNHMFTHSGEKPYHCEYCAVSFTQKTNLTMHVKRNHKDASVQYECHQCSASFSLRKQLRTHHREKHYDAIIKSLKPRGKSLNATDKDVLQRKLETRPKKSSDKVEHPDKGTILQGVLSSDKIHKLNQEFGDATKANFLNKKQATQCKASILDSHIASRTTTCEITQKDLLSLAQKDVDTFFHVSDKTPSSNCFSGLENIKDSSSTKEKEQTPRHRPNILPCRQRAASSNKTISQQSAAVVENVDLLVDRVKPEQGFPNLAQVMSSDPLLQLCQFDESNHGVKQVDNCAADEGLLLNRQEGINDVHTYPPHLAPADNNKPQISCSGTVHTSQNIIQNAQPLVSSPSDSSCLALFNSSMSDSSLQSTTAGNAVNVGTKICHILVPRSCAQGPIAESCFRGESGHSAMPIISRTRTNIQELPIKSATRTFSNQLAGPTSDQRENPAYPASLQPCQPDASRIKFRDKTRTRLSKRTSSLKTDSQKSLKVNSCLTSSATNDLMDLSLDVNAFANSVMSGARQALQLLNGGNSADSQTIRQKKPRVANQTVTDKLPSSLENCVHKKDTGMFVKFTNFLNGSGKSYRTESKSEQQPKVSATCQLSRSSSVSVTSAFSSSSITPLYTSKMNTTPRVVCDSANTDYTTVAPAGSEVNPGTAKAVTALRPHADSVPVVSLHHQHAKSLYPECTALTASTALNSAKVHTRSALNSTQVLTRGALNSTRVLTGGALNSTQLQTGAALNSTQGQIGAALNSTQGQIGAALNSTQGQIGAALNSTQGQIGGALNNTQVRPWGALNSTQLLTGIALDSTQVHTGGALNSTRVLTEGALNTAQLLTGGALNSTQLLPGGALNSTQVHTGGAASSTQMLTGGALNSTQVHLGGALNSTDLLTGGALNSTQVLTGGALNSTQVVTGGALNSAQVVTGDALNSTQVQTGNQVVQIQLVPVVPSITQQANVIPLVLQSNPWQQQVDHSIQTLDPTVLNINTVPTTAPGQTVLQNVVVANDLPQVCNGNIPLVTMPLSSLSVPGVVTINSTDCQATDTASFQWR